MVATPSRISIILIALAAVPLAQCRTRGDPTASQNPTFSRDVAPILFGRCGDCHRPGLAVPFSVFDYRDVKAHARGIASATRSRRMPPWLPEPNYGNFLNPRQLSPIQLDTIERWVKNGAPEGDPTDLPPIPAFDDRWQLGTPDLVLQMSEPYMLKPHGEDVFRNFVIPVPLSERRHVRGVEFRTENQNVVHHAMIGVDRSGVSRRLDREDPDPGFDGMRSEIHSPLGHFLGWTPGKAPFIASPDVAWPLDPGSDLVIQLHMLPDAGSRTIRAGVGLFFGDAPPRQIPFLVKLTSKTIDIPAGERNYGISDTYTLPTDVLAVSVYPHAHYLAKEMKADATLPDGRVEGLIWIKQWNFHWQDEYRYTEPLLLPKGTRLTMRFTYDNSADNPANSKGPPRRVVFGPRASDEMGDLWLQVLLRDSSDLAMLMMEYAERELQAEMAGAERTVQRMPRDIEARNFLATRYMRAGRMQEAVAQLKAALQVDSRAADVHANLGIALLSTGLREDGFVHLLEAVKLAPDNDRMHFHLGNALQANGDSRGAIRELRRAIALNPDFADAHKALAISLGFQNQLAEAVQHLQRALEIAPWDADTENNLGVALGLRGDDREAIQHFREALRLDPGHKDAQQNLATALSRTSATPNSRQSR